MASSIFLQNFLQQSFAFNSPMTPGMVLNERLLSTLHQLSRVIHPLQPEFPAKAFHALESAMLYDKGYINAENVAEERLSIDSLRKALDGWHPGVHSHVFQFEDVITKVFAPLCAMGLIDFDVLEARMSHQFGEFVVVLRAGRECTSWDSVKDFYSLSRDTITPKRGLLHALESKKNMLRRWYSSRGNQDGAGDPRTKK